jgi:hypothetical protein
MGPAGARMEDRRTKPVSGNSCFDTMVHLNAITIAMILADVKTSEAEQENALFE